MTITMEMNRMSAASQKVAELYGDLVRRAGASPMGSCPVELTAAFLLLRLDYALLLALVTAVIDALPVLGTGTVLLPWAAYSFLTGNVPLGAGLAVTYAAVTVLHQSIQAKLLGDQLRPQLAEASVRIVILDHIVRVEHDQSFDRFPARLVLNGDHVVPFFILTSNKFPELRCLLSFSRAVIIGFKMQVDKHKLAAAVFNRQSSHKQAALKISGSYRPREGAGKRDTLRRSNVIVGGSEESAVYTPYRR